MSRYVIGPNSELVLYDAALDTMLNNPRGDVGKYLARRGRLTTALAKRQVGVRTGHLRASITMRQGRDARGQYVKIGSNVRHALLHHEGTRPHVIVAQRAHVLVFMKRGKVIHTPIVFHPGTKPNRYLSDNLPTMLL